jgi:hypothetical protein
MRGQHDQGDHRAWSAPDNRASDCPESLGLTSAVHRAGSRSAQLSATVAMQQQRGSGVVRGSEPQREAARTIATPMTAAAPAPRAPGTPSGVRRRPRSRSASQRRAPAPARDHERAQPMRQVNGRARRVVEHAALVVGAGSPRNEGCAEVRLRPPGCVLTGWKVRTGRRRVVAAGPAAEGDLHAEQQADEAISASARASWRTPSMRPSRAAFFRRDSGCRRDDRTSHHSSASVVKPNSRCSVTTSGLSCRVTVSMPSTACAITIASSATTNVQRQHAVTPAHRADQTTSITIKKPSVPAA